MAGIYNNCRFLVVEDDAITASSLSAMLTTYGATEVLVAHSVAEARDIIKSHAGDHIDAAILDIDLGETDCFGLTPDLEAAAVPFLFHSGRRGEYPNLLEQYRVPFVAKPSSDFDLIFALEKVLGWPGEVPPEVA